jgi:hypothetical protein
MSTEILRPEGDLSAAWDNPGTQHFSAVSDSDDGTTIRTLSPAVDRFSLPPLPSFVTAVSGVGALARIQCGDGIGSVRLLLWDGTNLVTGPTWIGPASLTTFLWTPAVPGGGSWTVAKVNALELRVECVAVAFAEVVCADVWLPVEAAASVVVTRRPVVVPGARGRVRAPGGRGLVAAPGGARLDTITSGARGSVVVPVRRVEVLAGPLASD